MRTWKKMVLMWLLVLTAGSAVTLSQDHTLPPMTEETSNWLSTKHEASTFKATSSVSGIQTASVAAVKGDDSNRSATPRQQGLQFEASTVSMNVTTSLNNSDSTLPNNSSESTNIPTEPPLTSKDTAPPSSRVTNQTSTPYSAVTWTPTSPNINQTTGHRAQSTGDDQPPTSPSLSNPFFSTQPIQSTPGKVESTRTNPSVKTTEDLLSSLPLTTKKSLVRTTRTKKDPPQSNSKTTNDSGIIVACIIGGALVIMLIGFIVIFFQRKRYKQQQVLTKDWAGPSPFLENNADNGHVNLTSANRISFSSFLPQRLSRKLSLLPEEDQELEDIITGTTFGGKQETSGKAETQSIHESNGTAAGAPEVKIEGNSTGTSSQANEEPPTDKNLEETVQNTDDPIILLPPSGTAEN